jgi:hypothetical protein
LQEEDYWLERSDQLTIFWSDFVLLSSCKVVLSTCTSYTARRGVKKLVKRAAIRDRNPQMTRFLNFEKSFFLKPNMALLFAVVNIFIS